jgi:hypothetical protein
MFYFAYLFYPFSQLFQPASGESQYEFGLLGAGACGKPDRHRTGATAIATFI